jgi:hypothetical protein
MMLIMFAKRHVKLQRGAWVSEKLRSFHRIWTGILITEILIYVFVYGDVPVSFPGMLLTIAILEGMYVSNKNELPKEASQEVMQPQRMMMHPAVAAR